MRAGSIRHLLPGLLLAPALAAQTIPGDPVYGDQFESGLVGFGPNLSVLPQGAVDATTLSSPLTLTLSEAPMVDTFVPVVSASPLDLAVSGGGVTVAAGQTSALVRFSALAANASPVIVSAQVGNARSAAVRVQGAANETNSPAEADFCNVQFPQAFQIVAGNPTPQIFGQLYEAGATEAQGPPPGWIAELGFGPDGSDPRQLAGWQFVSAAWNVQVLNNDEFHAGLVAPAAPGAYRYTYRFSQDQGGNWTYCDTDGAGSGSGLGFEPSALGSMVVVPPRPAFAINEVDYDQNGTDTAEFIELVNGTASAASLQNLVVVLINGATSTEYDRVQLSGTLAAGQYAVICPLAAMPGTCPNTVAVPPGTRVFNFGFATNAIQNGAPDAVGLLDLTTGTLVDALSYEGAVNAGLVTGIGTFNFVEGTATTAIDGGIAGESMQRRPNASDTDNALLDWTTATATPGAPNQ